MCTVAGKVCQQRSAWCLELALGLISCCMLAIGLLNLILSVKVCTSTGKAVYTLAGI